MLRKDEGITPLDHRGIATLSTCHRLASGVWWNRLIEALCEWVHPNAHGGLPKRECLMAAFEAQLDMEHAVIGQYDHSFVSADYWKFFDTFDPDFFYYVMIEVGIPKEMAVLVHHFNTTCSKHLKIGSHIGTPMDSDRGACQGDTWSLLNAIFITTTISVH